MKRISFWITVVLSCCIFSTANAEPQCGVILDVNGDRKTGLEEAIYALQVVAGIQGQCNSKETEPNDSFSEATSVGLNEETVGKIETAGDEDYFKFTTSKAGVIEVSVEPVPSDIRLVARLYDAQQEQIDYKHASETGGIIFFKKLSDAGVHYLKLEGEYSSSKSDEPYTVQIGLDIFDSYEINNSFASASSVSLDTDVRGKIEDEGDEDYFKFITPQAGVIEISINPVPSDIRLTARLYDAQQDQIDYKTASEAGGIIFFKELNDAGVHYLKLEGEYSSSNSDKPYTVQIELDTFDSYEMNNSFADASIISLNTDVRGKIEGGGDKDYFKFTTSKAGIIEISVNPVPSDIRLTARLYDAQQNHINSRTSQEAGSSIFFSTTTDTGGVYYLKLEGEYSSSDSDEPYTVNVKLK